MCELFCLSSRLPTAATFSLHRFAARSGQDGHTVDGWGLAFYDGRDLRLYREPAEVNRCTLSGIARSLAKLPSCKYVVHRG
jgi:glutamine amidotransferase